MTVFGGFWNHIISRDFPVNNVIRAKLELQSDETALQPLVQVQCIPIWLDALRESSTTRNVTVSGFDINTFSTKNASKLQIPDWLFDLEYKPPNELFLDTVGRPRAHSEKTTNVTWVQPLKDSGFDQSIAAIVVTPMVTDQPLAETSNWQAAFVHVCSVDARWIASKPSYDPAEDAAIAHNISEPLLFRKPKKATENTYKSDVVKWGISPSVKLSTEWAEMLNIPKGEGNLSAPSLQMLLSRYVLANNNSKVDTSTRKRRDLTMTDVTQTNDTVTYIFDIGAKGQNFFVNSDTYGNAASETVATLLSLQLTDALARVLLADAQKGLVILGQINDTYVQAAQLYHAAGLGSSLNGSAVSASIVNEKLTPGFTFKVSRYGYGYGFRTATIYFGVMVLLAHSLLTVIYIIYALYEFFYVKHWTSNSWSSIGDLIVLLINSEPSMELQNTCAGIDSKLTWRKRVYIREMADTHVGVVVGELNTKIHGPVRWGVEYGSLEGDQLAS
jgi:hypothetical protein